MLAEEFKRDLAKLVWLDAAPTGRAPLDWQQLQLILTQFDHIQAHFRALPRQAEVDRHRHSIKRSATNLVKALEPLVGAEGQLDLASLQAGRLIEANLKSNWRFEITPQNQRGGYEWELSDVIDLLRFLAAAAQTPLHGAAMHDVTKTHLGWQRFIRELQQWWQVVTGMRATARKDSDKTSDQRSSPFVEFTFALLKALPSDTRPTHNSAHALATAINEALRSREK